MLKPIKIVGKIEKKSINSKNQVKSRGNDMWKQKKVCCNTLFFEIF